MKSLLYFWLRGSILLATLLTPGQAGHAQDRSAVGGLAGRVLDAGSGAPLVLSRVTLVSGAKGFFPSDIPEQASVVGARSRLTDDAGRYAFHDVPPGYYRLFVRRIGYRPATIDLHLEGREGLDLSVGLSVAPIRLEPIESQEAPSGLLDDPQPDEERDDTARERWRQDMFAATDVGVIGQADVDNAVTFGERDVLRALRKLPGVTARDDWSAEPWVRGAPAGHTRVYLDGIPVFSPVHSGGLNASVDPDALSAVFLHPGVRPPGIAEGAAAVVDLRTRSARGLGDLNGRVSLSGARVGGSVSRRWLGGRIGTIVTTGGSWLQGTRRLVKGDDGATAEIPNSFASLIFRGDALLTDRVSLETTVMWQRDFITGHLEGGPANNFMDWGSSVGRVTLQFPLGSGSFRQTVGGSWFSNRVLQMEPRVPLAAFDDEPTQEPTENSLRYVLLRGEWTDPLPDAVGIRWRFGYEFGHYKSKYRGAPPTPYSVLTYLYTLELTESVKLGRVWGERWWRPGDSWTIRVGIRAEQYASDNETFIEPYVAVRHDVNDRLRLSFTTARHAQYAQPLAPAGLLFGPGLSSGQVWLLAPTVGRSLVSDVSTIGGDLWLGDAWLAAAHMYWRETDWIAIPDPIPGTTDDDRFQIPAFNDARGTEVSIRKLAGRWTGSLAYTLGFATYTADHIDFPAPTDRRHVFDITTSTDLPVTVEGGRIGLNTAVNLASGAPYTRIHPGWYDCSDYEPGGHCEAIVPTLVERPNAERAPWTAGIDLRVEWTRAFSGWRIGAHAQVHNVLNAARAMTYRVDEATCRRRSIDDPFCGAEQDSFIPGMRRHVELGLRLVF